MTYYKKFDSGLRLVVAKMQGLYSVTMGIMVGAGSVNESQNLNGISHFIEHTTFKGTQKRTSFQVSDDAEFIGAKINAYTSKDATAYYIKSTTDKVADSFEILSDIFVNASYDTKEIEREKSVVCEEISMVEDTPDEICLDLLSTAFFGDQGYGKTILGTRQNVNSFTQQDILNYRNACYTAENTVVVFAGNVDEQLAEKLTLEYIEGKLPQKGKIEPIKSQLLFNSLSCKKEIEQAHFAIAYKGVKFGDEKQDLLMIASTVLGGGMSSRLFQKIREELGLCYTVFAYPSFYKDTGSLVVYSGVNPLTTRQAYLAVKQVVVDFCLNGITEKEFTRAKNQILSSHVMSQESTASLMTAHGKYLLETGEVYDYEKTVKRIEGVKYEQVNDFIKNMDITNFATALVSPNPDQTVLD